MSNKNTEQMKCRLQEIVDENISTDAYTCMNPALAMIKHAQMNNFDAQKQKKKTSRHFI